MALAGAQHLARSARFGYGLQERTTPRQAHDGSARDTPAQLPAALAATWLISSPQAPPLWS